MAYVTSALILVVIFTAFCHLYSSVFFTYLSLYLVICNFKWNHLFIQQGIWLGEITPHLILPSFSHLCVTSPFPLNQTVTFHFYHMQAGANSKASNNNNKLFLFFKIPTEIEDSCFTWTLLTRAAYINFSQHPNWLQMFKYFKIWMFWIYKFFLLKSIVVCCWFFILFFFLTIKTIFITFIASLIQPTLKWVALKKALSR